MSKITYESQMPLYQQICDDLYCKIQRGEYKPGERIPPEESLRTAYHVSRVTVRAALDKLIENGVLTKKRGKGTFVTIHPFLESADAQGSFTKSCKMKGVRPTTRLIFAGVKKPTSSIRKCLSLEKEDKIVCLIRIRMADGVPVIFEEDYFSCEHKYLLDTDVEGQPIREAIGKNCGSRVARYVDYFDVCPADKEQAEWLNCEHGTPMLRVQQFVYSELGQIIYYNRQIIRNDIYKYVRDNILLEAKNEKYSIML